MDCIFHGIIVIEKRSGDTTRVSSRGRCKIFTFVQPGIFTEIIPFFGKKFNSFDSAGMQTWESDGRNVSLFFYLELKEVNPINYIDHRKKKRNPEVQARSCGK